MFVRYSDYLYNATQATVGPPWRVRVPKYKDNEGNLVS
jgi:hypothetical protein